MAKPLRIWHHSMYFPSPSLAPHRNDRWKVQGTVMVAARSRAAAARAFGVTSRWLATWGAEGANEDWAAVALSEPGQVFWQPIDASRGRGHRGPAPWAKKGEPWMDDL